MRQPGSARLRLSAQQRHPLSLAAQHLRIQPCRLNLHQSLALHRPAASRLQQHLRLPRCSLSLAHPDQLLPAQSAAHCQRNGRTKGALTLQFLRDLARRVVRWMRCASQHRPSCSMQLLMQAAHSPSAAAAPAGASCFARLQVDESCSKLGMLSGGSCACQPHSVHQFPCCLWAWAFQDGGCISAFGCGNRSHGAAEHWLIDMQMQQSGLSCSRRPSTVK